MHSRSQRELKLPRDQPSPKHWSQLELGRRSRQAAINMLLMLTIRFFALVAASSLVSVVKFATIRATQELSGMIGVPGERAYETGHYWLPTGSETPAVSLRPPDA